MPLNFPTTDSYSFSFGHGVVKVDGRQFTALQNVKINHALQESPVHGTDIYPIGRSLGQFDLGQGLLVFSDFEESTDFFFHLGSSPFTRLWSLDYVLAKSDATRSIELISCRLKEFDLDHQSGSEALPMSYPFSFLRLKVNGVDLSLSPKALIQAGLSIGQEIANLL